MNKRETVEPSEYILDAFEPSNRIAVLALNRDLRETVQRITSAEKAASPDFQAWLRYKNANGSDIYIGMLATASSWWKMSSTVKNRLRKLAWALTYRRPYLGYVGYKTWVTTATRKPLKCYNI
jgi:hypothetical protein